MNSDEKGSISVGIKKLVDERFNGNMNTCARVINVAPSTISRVVSGKSNGSIKLVVHVVDYCNKRNLKTGDYIFFN
ncbi:MAG: hypothetical protein E7214_09995 [Clostridium sp.]|nr:hypothetical protein [Clostridium sp.]